MFSKTLYFLLFIIIHEQCFCEIVGEYKTRLTDVVKCPNEPEDSFKNHVSWNVTDGVDQLNMVAHVTRPVGPFGAEVTVKRWNGNKYIDVFKLKTMKLCELLLFRIESRLPDFKSNFKFDSRCYVPKGTQWINITDANKFTHTFLGNQMIYGKYFSKIAVHCGKFFIGCREIYYSVEEPVKM